MSRTRLWVVGALVAAFAAQAVGHARTGGGGATAADVRRPGRVPPASDALRAGGLELRLSEGAQTGEAPVLVARPAAERLSEAEVRRVLDRLPALTAPAREEPFAIREASLPPPRTGRTVNTAFPPADERSRPDTAATEPLEIQRRMPEGDVPLAPHLSITFSQPMVALDSHAGLAREAVPARLSPQPPGEWRWVGTRTLVFEPAGRFPMATDYQVEVPAGTRAVSGGTLASASGWSFSTPPPRLVARHPEHGPARRDTLMLAAFDQDVDPAAIVASLRVRAGGATVPVRLATASEVQADEAVARLAKATLPGRVVVFRADREMPADTEVAVAVGAGTPSAEGPRRTATVQEWTFRTYGPFRVRRHECGWNGRCTPFDPWRVELTNPVDAKSLRKDLVRVEPDVPAIKLEAWGDTLALRGAPRGRTTYRVSLSSEIKDVFGQPLAPGEALAFAVGPSPAALFAPGGDFVVLDPAGGARLTVHSVNHASLRVEAYVVGPEHWAAWHAYRQKGWRNEATPPPGRRVIATTVRVGGEPDALTQTRLDLTPAFEGGFGQAILVVQPTVPSKERRGERIQAWVQSTRIGLDAFADAQTLLAWASDLSDGRPLADVDVALVRPAARGPLPDSSRTDASGLARLALGDAPAPLLVARRANDVAILPSQTGWWSEGAGWRKATRVDSLRFCVFDDRKVYRPGEEVRLKGWLRRLVAGPRGDVEAVPASLSALDWVLRDSQGNEVAKGNAGVSRFGAFDLTLKLPATMNLGEALLQIDAAGTGLAANQHTHVFQVQEFRRPEFEVKAQASEGPHVVGGAATVSVSAAYYAGGALPGAEVSWRVSAKPGTFRPPNRDDFVFGTFVPWWERASEPVEPERAETMSARTDGSGVHRLRVDFDRASPPRPRVVRAEATVMDVNRQAWTAGADLLVHPSELYVGLRTEGAFVQKGEPVVIDAIATDVEGLAIAGRTVRLRAERLDWEQVEGEWKEVPKDAQERALESTGEPVRARFEAKEGGAWRIVARVADERGRENETELRVWVAGGRVPPRRDLEEEKVTLVPDRKAYRAGDVAKVLVLSPFAPAEGILTLRRSGLLREERFTIAGGSHTLEIPVLEGFTPNVHVQVDLVGQAPRGEASEGAASAGVPARPAFASGALDLPVPPASRTLDLAVTPREKALSPGGETVLDLVLRDAAGGPVANGEAAVVVVDEAVLALTGYRLPDPIEIFYARRGTEVTDHRLRSHVLLARPDEIALQEGGAGGGDLTRSGALAFQAPMEGALPASAPAPQMMRSKAMSAEDRAPEPIRARTDFSALALFAASLPTDAEGRAHVTVKLPDNLTRYRVMAVAVEGARRFGSGEATLVARLPLMVRPSPPRFLNFGDRFELPVVVQNQTDAEMTVDVAVRAQNAALTAGAGRRLVVAANDRAEVRFPMAAVRAGQVRLQVGAASGQVADAAEVELPVWTPATTEAFATYGQVDDGTVVQPVKAPAGVVPDFGGLEVTTSSTALQALTDAVLYLVAYPFECAEQLSSRVLAVAALRDVLSAFQAEGLPKPEETLAAVKRDVERLRALQNGDGGFGFWRRGDESWPYVSIHVAHALARAKAKGFPVPDDTLERSRLYLREIDRHIPSRYGKGVRRTLQAYALSVRALLGDADTARARALVREAGVEPLSFEAVGWVLPLLSRDPASAPEVAAIRRRLANNVSETAAAAHFAVSYGDDAYLLLHSDRRADAILLEALIADQPRSDLIPKLVEGLLAHRRAGRWANTQENVFVLLALDRYFQAYEKTTPDFVARAWLGERYAGGHEFRGRTTERYRLAIPMADLREDEGATDLLLSKEGPGRLYYRIGLRYAPDSLVLEPLDRGFTVERSYEGVDDPKDVQRADDGTWRIRAGARVRVRLTMVAPSRRYLVALVDPLPAGLEPTNPALAVTGTAPGDGGSDIAPLGAPGLGGPGLPGHWWWWSRPWFDHQNLRDDRVEAFSALLWEGVHTYRYLARATTPGTFVVPPPKAEEMYSPETFGRGATDRVIVE